MTPRVGCQRSDDTHSSVEAIPDEPEAVPEDYQRQVSAESRRRWEVLRAEELALQATNSRKNKLVQLETEARRKRVDVSRHTIAIDRELNAMANLISPT